MKAVHVQSFKKKPVSIQAAQFNGKNSSAVAKWVNDNGGSAKARGSYILIDTLEGQMKVLKNHMVIKGVKGEFYPCRIDIFVETYAVSSQHDLVVV